MSQCRKEWDCKCQDVANNTYSCLRKLDTKEDSIICFFDDDEYFVEAYDLSQDPYQLTNLISGEEDSNMFHHEKVIESLQKIKRVIENYPV